MKEIERKYRVNNDTYKRLSKLSYEIKQGFLNTHPDRTVRVRIKGDQGFLTIKGRSNESGTTKFEWEKEIPVQEAQALLELCEEGVIEKTRYEVLAGKHTIEVDEFHRANQGLVMAEIELTHEDESLKLPNWLGEEVTGDIKYYNAMLSKYPYNTW
ncbi:CYTH domain-containing protein [Gangjinia marincola]|uniref:CYTH domain-containing protein n=1 Tax=Gangjinia marincola TaxID=578463 RepID=A0ABN1MHL3_9FLAO